LRGITRFTAMAINADGFFWLCSNKLPRAPLTVARMTFVPRAQASAKAPSHPGFTFQRYTTRIMVRWTRSQQVSFWGQVVLRESFLYRKEGEESVKVEIFTGVRG
jgi:hypothetical protein